MNERSAHRREGLWVSTLPAVAVALAALVAPASVAAQTDAPLASEAAPAAGREETPSVAAAAASPEARARFGVAARTRWISVPGWLLDAFTDANRPLSSYGLGLELFWRDKTSRIEVALAVTHQRMSPPDGNWLGAGNDPAIDTDFVQFRDVGLIGLDATVTWRTPLHPLFGVHYGVGLGVAIVTGEMLRTSAFGCTAGNVDDTRACRPRICPPTGCTEAILKASEGDLDVPEDPHRFAEDDLPGAVPILHALTGFHARHPSLPGFEARLEGGFYNALFLGLGVGYLF